MSKLAPTLMISVAHVTLSVCLTAYIHVRPPVCACAKSCDLYFVVEEDNGNSIDDQETHLNLQAERD